jgi:hypothetical protein
MSLPVGDGGVQTGSGNSFPPWIMRSLPPLSLTSRSEVPGMKTRSHGPASPSATSATLIFCRPALSARGSPAFGMSRGAAAGGCAKAVPPATSPATPVNKYPEIRLLIGLPLATRRRNRPAILPRMMFAAKAVSGTL